MPTENISFEQYLQRHQEQARRLEDLLERINQIAEAIDLAFSDLLTAINIGETGDPTGNPDNPDNHIHVRVRVPDTGPNLIIDPTTPPPDHPTTNQNEQSGDVEGNVNRDLDLAVDEPPEPPTLSGGGDDTLDVTAQTTNPPTGAPTGKTTQ